MHIICAMVFPSEYLLDCNLQRGLLHVIWNMIGSVYLYDVNIFIWTNADEKEKDFHLLENAKTD